MDCRQPICMNFRASRTSLFQKPVAAKFKSDKGRQLLSRNISAHFPHDILTLFRIFFPLSNPLNVHRLKRPPPHYLDHIRYDYKERKQNVKKNRIAKEALCMSCYRLLIAQRNEN